uniref:Uncharacterized protein n=1 Tax=Phytophthora fragariae TaxID=53985 RepID=A0A6A3EY55_9STRA|nr:hypothetical protein PF009_g11786 [Phytophthora fragariae]
MKAAMSTLLLSTTSGYPVPIADSLDSCVITYRKKLSSRKNPKLKCLKWGLIRFQLCTASWQLGKQHPVPFSPATKAASAVHTVIGTAFSA